MVTILRCKRGRSRTASFYATMNHRCNIIHEKSIISESASYTCAKQLTAYAPGDFNSLIPPTSPAKKSFIWAIIQNNFKTCKHLKYSQVRLSTTSLLINKEFQEPLLINNDLRAVFVLILVTCSFHEKIKNRVRVVHNSESRVIRTSINNSSVIWLKVALCIYNLPSRQHILACVQTRCENWEIPLSAISGSVR